MSCTATQLPAALHFLRPSTCPHLTAKLPFPGKPLSVFPIISVVPLLTPAHTYTHFRLHLHGRNHICTEAGGGVSARRRHTARCRDPQGEFARELTNRYCWYIAQKAVNSRVVPCIEYALADRKYSTGNGYVRRT